MHSEDFEEKLTLLNTTLRDSIEKVLEEAKNKNALLPPFGRPPTPTPFVDEDEEVCQDLEEDEADTRNDDAANFKYEYGFNPLIYLADFFHRAHPDSIAFRKKQKEDSKSRLRFRVEHARRQLSVGAGLAVRASQLRSGIIHGPLTSPCSPSSVNFFCRSVSAGEVVVQLSLQSDFSEAITSRFTSSGPEDPLKAVLTDLKPGTKYFCRCFQELPGEGGQDGDGEVCYASCQFWTLLDVAAVGSEGVHQEVELFAISGQRRRLPAEETGSSSFRVSGGDGDARPVFSVLVGDVFDHSVNTARECSPPSVDAQLWELFRGDPIYSPFLEADESHAMLCMSSMLCAWNDSQSGSDTGLKAEEIVHKQWSYDMRKYEKRQKERLEKEKKEAFEQKAGGPSPSRKRSVAPPPTLSRPAMSLAFSKLAKEFPLQYSEENVRHLYRSFALSRDVEVFILDSRNGYLGKDQVRWLKDGIRKSSAAMKILFSGQTFGLHFVDHLQPAQVNQENLETENEATVEAFEHDLHEGATEEKEELTVSLPERQDNLVESTVGDSTTGSPGNSAPIKSPPAAKKVSSSRQKALEATKEEFDEDGLSKSSLAHVLVSTHRKLYPSTDNEEETFSEEDFGGNLEAQDLDQNDVSSLDDKCVLTGGILIVSSSDSEESFAASYNFGRTAKEQQADEQFCLEVSLGRPASGTETQVYEERPAVTPADVLVSSGRKVLYRSGEDSDELKSNGNAMSCSIVVKEQGVVGITMKRVDTGAIVYERNISSALFVAE
mmetsp:Transcript_13009/g.24004  ORF Transcript_13009/g.24004 Transcript_13009/m.24004 type:complete len:774 (-) Transcript_13009:142-2463(-)|eukprot:CAMPEP_0114429892 /NCGR_PEP_ID=MMETSP0103-20121206/9738_1 /TAXON_ID=37642 ORGANISM="Paraphysomonas imperforata, Strain PA2" /NCGR_SAMPLE_ID=MMETSP0103 /ASSEMBLY_ACC=CAM_ASM_000201 /LENGTH=773 /DNA_ID=CAMNT_0001599279 /DNA_START=80 /DNA_END=2401 /DNA_ORIENTATION=-